MKEIVKDNLKYMIWPLLVLVLVLLFKDIVAERLRNSDIKIGEYLEVTGQQLQDISNTLQTAQQSGLDCDQLKATINGAQQQLNDVNGQIDGIKNGNVEEVGKQQEQIKQAKASELSGFEALTRGDRQQALENFSKAKQLYPSYHNVSEISQMLEQQQTDTISKAELNMILKDHSWGMPTDIRNALNKKTN